MQQAVLDAQQALMLAQQAQMGRRLHNVYHSKLTPVQQLRSEIQEMCCAGRAISAEVQRSV